MTSPSKNMQKLALIFTSISAGWAWWLQSLETNTINTAYPTSWYIYTILSLGGWSAWIVYYTMIKSNRELTPGPKPHQLWNLLHIVPMLLLNATITKSLSVKDVWHLWFTALMVFRYWRTVGLRFFHTQYKMALNDSPHGPSFNPWNCTVIIATVGPANNPNFPSVVEGVLRNKPKRLIFCANSSSALKQTENTVNGVEEALKEGRSSYQEYFGLPTTAFDSETKIVYEQIDISNKRQQTYHGFKMVETDITFMVDDTAIWHPRLLQAVLPAFNDEDIGLVGTRKWVRYDRPSYNPEMSRFQFCIDWYRAGFWNTVGASYLQRHNYEIEASNTADGSVFAVSGRTMAIRTSILKDDKFEKEFLNEYVYKWVFDWLMNLKTWYVPGANHVLAWCKKNGLSENGFGPLRADDDNFITRWVINHGKSVKIQSSPEATITTVLGCVKTFKFWDQCHRWSRTTFRQNPIALFSDRTIWWKWPIGVWTVYFPWLYNFAAFWDPMAVYTFWRSGLYRDSPHGNMRFFYLVLFIWSTKLIKTLPWFLEHPGDFFLFFFPTPACPLFSYVHSGIKIWTAITCFNNEWSGRVFKKAEDDARVVAGTKSPKEE